MSTFWERQLSQQQPPPHVPQAGSSPPGAWWQTPASGHLQPPTPPPGQPGPDSASYSYQQLKAMKADDMNQDMMEQLAVYELREQKYNNVCPNCQSTNFLPQGSRVGTQRMGTDKCFECGASASTLTGSPEPAVGGSTGKAGRATRQTAAGGQGNYGQHVSQLPSQYLPRS